ncbi:MAG: thrombospondin [Candidatus Parcubacteria bacterium]|jgi:hypothetical protein
MFRPIVILVLTLLIIVAPVYAAPREDATAFRTIFALAPLTITLPSVVEVDLSQYSFSSAEFMVYEVGSNAWVTPTYRNQSETLRNKPVVTDSDTGNRIPALTDKNQATPYTFQVAGNQISTVTLNFTYSKPITAGQLVLDLSQNVQLPRTVMISVGDGDNEQVALATTAVTGRTIVFPKLTGTVWKVTFTHNQPLRISELTFVDEAAPQQITKSLRFLAQPGQSYVVYANPDRPNTVQGRESGNVWGNTVVPVPVQVLSSKDNPYYVQKDSDKDTVPDEADNCPFIANLDQIDVNANKQGDACEDFDQDGAMNNTDNCPDLPNRYQADKDSDGIGDECDDDESRLTEKYAWLPWVALGAALLTIVGMFVVVSRRPLPSEQTAVSDNTTTML